MTIWFPAIALTLTVVLFFAQVFGASFDSLEHFFHLALLVGRDILKCTFDESGVLAEDRNEYSASLLSNPHRGVTFRNERIHKHQHKPGRVRLHGRYHEMPQ